MTRDVPNHSSLPVSELAWRQVRHKITTRLQDTMRQLPLFLAHLNLSRLPPQIVCPGRTEPRVRFLLPIPIKGKPAEEEAAGPSVQGVR